MRKFETRKRYTFTLDPSVVEQTRERAHTLGFKLSTWINHVLSRTEGLVMESDLPPKETIENDDEND